METKTLFTMKKLFITMCLLSMISSLSYAQNLRYGFTGGVNLSKPTGDVEPDGVREGLLLGVKGELKIPAIKGLYTEFGLQLSTKAHKSGLVIGFENEYLQSTTDINYLNIPIHIGYKIKCSESISFLVNAGPYFGVGMWGKQKFYRDEKKYHSASDIFSGEYGYKRFDYGCGFNIGVEYAKHFQLTLGADWGLKDICKKSSYKYRNRSFTISLGYIL